MVERARIGTPPEARDVLTRRLVELDDLLTSLDALRGLLFQTDPAGPDNPVAEVNRL